MVLMNEIKEIVFRLCAKNGHGTPSIPDFNYYANLSNIDLFNYHSNPQKTVGMNGKPAPKTSAGFSKLNNGVLKPFIKPATLTVSGGQVNTPSDLEVMDTMRYGNVTVDWIPQHKLGAILSSTIDAPTLEYPVYTDTSTGFSVYPTTITTVTVSYLKTPVTVEWKYTLVNGRQVYSPTGTIDFEWGQSQKLNLITRILGYVGVEIRDGELINYVSNEQNKAS